MRLLYHNLGLSQHKNEIYRKEDQSSLYNLEGFIMNIEYGTGSRLYSYGVSGLVCTGGATALELVDTNGILVACNYVDVTVVGDTNAAGETIFVSVALSGLGNNVPSVSAMVSGGPLPPATGATCGFTLAVPGASQASERYAWHGWRRDEVKGLSIRAVSPTSTNKVDIAITYGNLIHYNKPFTNVIETIGS
jgi:hypothetical protein